VAEIEFERALEKMFSDTPDLADSEVFASRVAGRLDRGWATRRFLIGAAGVVGGVIGASQLIMSNLMGRAELTSLESTRVLTTMKQIAPQADWLLSRPAGIETIWVAAALAVLAMGFAITRIIEEI
jgi:hypothetical protein